MWLTQAADAGASAIVSFFHYPLKLWPSVIIAFVLGALNPLVIGLLDGRGHLSSMPKYPWIGNSVMCVLVGVMYWASNRRFYVITPRRICAAIALIVLSLSIACASYYCCFWQHCCMAGHMQHPPYMRSDYLNDFSWVGLLLVAVVALGRWRSPLTVLVAFSAGFLISYRLAFGSFGGVYYPL